MALAGVDEAARNLERSRLDAVAPLPHQHDLPVVTQRNDIDPVHRVEDQRLALLTLGLESMPLDGEQSVGDEILDLLLVPTPHADLRGLGRSGIVRDALGEEDIRRASVRAPRGAAGIVPRGVNRNRRDVSRGSCGRRSGRRRGRPARIG